MLYALYGAGLSARRTRRARAGVRWAHARGFMLYAFCCILDGLWIMNYGQ